MERRRPQPNCLECFIIDLHGLWVGALVDLRLDPKTGARGCVGNQLDDHLEAGERTTTPVHTDVGPHPVLDLVPLARTRWKVTNDDVQARLIGELL